jgi:hypothetical protein
MENWVNIIASILSGLVVCIPLVIELVKYIRKTIQEKNWTNVMQIVLKLMTEAEKNYATGAERKEYVMDSIMAIKDTLNYEVDMDAISQMIDSIVAASKTINAEIKAAE